MRSLINQFKITGLAAVLALLQAVVSPSAWALQVRPEGAQVMDYAAAYGVASFEDLQVKLNGGQFQLSGDAEQDGKFINGLVDRAINALSADTVDDAAVQSSVDVLARVIALANTTNVTSKDGAGSSQSILQVSEIKDSLVNLAAQTYASNSQGKVDAQVAATVLGVAQQGLAGQEVTLADATALFTAVSGGVSDGVAVKTAANLQAIAVSLATDAVTQALGNLEDNKAGLEQVEATLRSVAANSEIGGYTVPASLVQLHGQIAKALGEDLVLNAQQEEVVGAFLLSTKRNDVDEAAVAARVVEAPVDVEFNGLFNSDVSVSLQDIFGKNFAQFPGLQATITEALEQRQGATIKYELVDDAPTISVGEEQASAIAVNAWDDNYTVGTITADRASFPLTGQGSVLIGLNEEIQLALVAAQPELKGTDKLEELSLAYVASHFSADADSLNRFEVAIQQLQDYAVNFAGAREGQNYQTLIEALNNSLQVMRAGNDLGFGALTTLDGIQNTELGQVFSGIAVAAKYA